jgi:hypothetical protein
MGVLHPLCLIGIGAASGYALVTFGMLALEVSDLVAAGRVEQPVVWPDRRCLTVWTGQDWFTVTVMPVAFGRWGIAVCRDVAPRRPWLRELVERAQTEQEARDCAAGLAGRVLSERLTEAVAFVAQ